MVDSTRSPASPAIRKPTATICPVVFHLASRVTGTPTRSSARYSRKPDTSISRQRMTTAASRLHPRIVSSAASISRQDATSNLSAIGSSMTQRGLLTPRASKIPVENVGPAGQNEDRQSDPSQPQWPIENALPEHQSRHHRNGGDACIGKQIGQRERPRWQRAGTDGIHAGKEHP